MIEQNLIYAMLTLPLDVGTVTLPATLWFFDKGKRDDRILFVDARNVFTQVDRADRYFSDEQLHNLAVISQLHKGRRERFVQLVDRYFAEGMKRLAENEAKVQPVSAQLLEVLDDDAGRHAVADLVKQWAGLGKLRSRYEQYRAKYAGDEAVERKNRAQRHLHDAFAPLFGALHETLKQLDRIFRQREKHQGDAAQGNGGRPATDRRTKALKAVLGELHREVKNAELFHQHIHWLQQRFPNAEYEDVTGLCKLATRAEVKEQEYSLNPGRYVGVVIEEDGKTEEEFIDEILTIDTSLEACPGCKAQELQRVISEKSRAVAGER